MARRRRLHPLEPDSVVDPPDPDGMRPGTVRREHRFDDAKIVFDGGGSLSSRLLLRGWQTGRARTTAMFACALFAQPIALAAQAPSM